MDITEINRRKQVKYEELDKQLLELENKLTVLEKEESAWKQKIFITIEELSNILTSQIKDDHIRLQRARVLLQENEEVIDNESLIYEIIITKKNISSLKEKLSKYSKVL